MGSESLMYREVGVKIFRAFWTSTLTASLHGEESARSKLERAASCVAANRNGSHPSIY
jgi:hypothetical protein